MSSPTFNKPIVPPFMKHKIHFQTSFVLLSVMYLKDVDVQQVISSASFKPLPSNLLCLYIEVKLGCLGSFGCAELMLSIRSCFVFLCLLYPPLWIHWCPPVLITLSYLGQGLFFSLFSYEFLSHDWEVLLTDESSVNWWPLHSKKSSSGLYLNIYKRLHLHANLLLKTWTQPLI